MNLDATPVIKNVTKGFKAVNLDLQTGELYCAPTMRNKFIFEVGKMYDKKTPPILCKVGFHFCRDIKNVLDHYSVSPDVFFTEIDTCNSKTNIGFNKTASQKIKIVKVIPYLDLKKQLGYTVLEEGIKMRMYTSKKSYNFTQFLFNTPEMVMIFQDRTVERKTVTLTKIKLQRKYGGRNYYIVS